MYSQNQMNDNISKKFLANDKILESMAMQLEGFNYVIKNQLSFNELIKTKVTQLALSCRNHNTGELSCRNHNTGELPEQPGVNPKENGNAVTVRARQSAQRPHLPQDAGTR